MRYLLLCAFIFGSSNQLFASNAEPSGKLWRVNSFVDNVYDFECVLPRTSGDLKVQIQLDSESLMMKIKLENGLLVRGYATFTSNPLKQEVTYFLANGFNPFKYEFSLVMSNDGSIVKFTKVFGAHEFNCSL